MQDGIIKGTGNSRYLKSISNFLQQYPTYQDFVAALVAGTLPVDLNGINETGWDQLGTALNKANLLSDETAAALGLPNTAVPDDAFMVASKVLQAGNCKIEHGSYKGTGNYSSAHPNRLTFSGEPLLVIVYGSYRGATFVNAVNPSFATMFPTEQYIPSIRVSWGNNSISWNADSADNQLNQSNTTYYYVGLLSASE